MGEQKESFVFYRGFRDAVRELPEEYQLQVLHYLMDYAFDGREPEESGIAKAMFLSFKPQIDAAQKRYTTNVENGKKGGRPKQEQNQEQTQGTKKENTEKPNHNPKKPKANPSETEKNPTVTQQNPAVTEEEPKANLNDNDNVNDNDNDNKNDNENTITSSCTELEQSSSMPEEAAAMILPLNDGTEYPIYERDVGQWQELYGAVDVMQELKNMKGWLDANTTKRKTKHGIRRFINGWLAREQDKGGRRSGGNLNGAGKNTAAGEAAERTYQYGDVF